MKVKLHKKCTRSQNIAVAFTQEAAFTESLKRSNDAVVELYRSIWKGVKS